MTHSIANFIKPFFSHYLPIQRGLALNTILAYRDAIKLVLCYTADTLHKNVEELCVEDVYESLVLQFLDNLENTRGCSVQNPQCQNGSYLRPLQFYRPGRAFPVAPLPDDSYHPH